MISDPGLIHYASIAKGTTVLADYNSRDDAAVSATTAKCLEKTPPFHAIFTHTARSRTYTFLIEDPFVYFLISDDKLEKSEGLGFLKSVRDAFVKGERKLDKLSRHCFQGELKPVFRGLVGVGVGVGHVELKNKLWVDLMACAMLLVVWLWFCFCSGLN